MVAVVLILLVGASPTGVPETRNLIWARPGEALITWFDAKSACEALSSDKKWRLPSRRELSTLIADHGIPEFIKPTINKGFRFWTSDTYAEPWVNGEKAGAAWLVNFQDGGTGVNRKRVPSARHICVSGVYEPLIQATWNVRREYVSWEKASQLCSTHGGRLATIEELRAVVDTSKISPAAIDSVPVSPAWYWSGTTTTVTNSSCSHSCVRAVEFSKGFEGLRSANSLAYPLCVN